MKEKKYLEFPVDDFETEEELMEFSYRLSKALYDDLSEEEKRMISKDKGVMIIQGWTVMIL